MIKKFSFPTSTLLSASKIKIWSFDKLMMVSLSNHGGFERCGSPFILT